MTRQLLFATFVLCAAFSAQAQAQAATDALRQAGELRTLSQRIPKLYFQQLLALNDAQAKRALAESATAVEKHLETLRSVSATPALARRYARTVALWAQCREFIDHPPTLEGAETLNYLSNDLMISAGRLTFMLESQTVDTGARLVDLSMRQSMLAQRLAKLYLARRLLGEAGASRVDVHQARLEFETSMKEIATAPELTQQTRDALELAEGQWIFFDRAIAEGDKGDERLALHVSTTSERITESMRDIVASYEATRRIAPAHAGQRSKQAVAAR